MKRIIPIVIVLCLVACRSVPSSFYMLAPASYGKESVVIKKNINVGIFVKVPKYVERPQIVTKKNDVEMQLSEFHRWIAPLEDNLTEVITDDMLSLSKKIKVIPTSANRKNFDYTIIVEFKRFDAVLGDKAVISAVWAIKDKDDKVLFSKMSYLENVISGEYDDMVKKLSDMTGSLAKEITLKLGKLK